MVLPSQESNRRGAEQNTLHFMELLQSRSRPVIDPGREDDRLNRVTSAKRPPKGDPNHEPKRDQKSIYAVERLLTL